MCLWHRISAVCSHFISFCLFYFTPATLQGEVYLLTLQTLKMFSIGSLSPCLLNRFWLTHYSCSLDIHVTPSWMFSLHFFHVWPDLRLHLLNITHMNKSHRVMSEDWRGHKPQLITLSPNSVFKVCMKCLALCIIQNPIANVQFFIICHSAESGLPYIPFGINCFLRTQDQ
jgi:hypothetical protein